MNAPERIFLPDVQATADIRQLAIQNVGVKGLRYPHQFDTADGENGTVACVAMCVTAVVRDIALRLMKEPPISYWKVVSENFESIHNHSAYAQLYGSNE